MIWALSDEKGEELDLHRSVMDKTRSITIAIWTEDGVFFSTLILKYTHEFKVFAVSDQTTLPRLVSASVFPK